jgi:hypothetical protein
MQKIPRHILSNLDQQNILITGLNNLKILALMAHEFSTVIKNTTALNYRNCTKPSLTTPPLPPGPSSLSSTYPYDKPLFRKRTKSNFNFTCSGKFEVLIFHAL